jgi:hypothetical protein
MCEDFNQHRDFWTPSPIHGDGWYYCADTGAYENHWVLNPQEQLESAARDSLGF